MKNETSKTEQPCTLHSVSNSFDYIKRWIREQEQPSTKYVFSGKGRTTLTAHYLLKHLEKNYNITKK